MSRKYDIIAYAINNQSTNGRTILRTRIRDENVYIMFHMIDENDDNLFCIDKTSCAKYACRDDDYTIIYSSRDRDACLHFFVNDLSR